MNDISDSVYRQLCSTRTVQSDKNGFFNDFYLEARQTCGEKWLKNYFGQLKSDQARILSIFNDRELCDVVMGVLENVRPVFKPKDNIFASQRRIQAEKALLLGDLKQALGLANLAVMRATKDENSPSDNDLALALWTRSSVLLQLGDGERVLSDLKLATTYGLDIKQNPDYYLKSAKAYALTGENMRANIALSVAEKLAHGPSAKIDKFREDVQNTVVSAKQVTPSKPPPTAGENAKLKGASSLAKLVESTDKGKFIVAQGHIKTGDIVLSEDPVVACLLHNFFGSHCHNCLEKLVTPVPCPTCSGIAFCSEQCMGEACSSYHRFECEYMDMFIGSGMSILCFIALRIFTKSASLQEGLALANNLITHLCAHSLDRQPDDFLQRGLMASFLMRCLQKSGFFGTRKTESVCPSAEEIQVAAALLGLLQVLQFNVHEIYETMIKGEHKFDDSKVMYVGAGLYGSGSYFNHACWPTVARYFVGKSIVLVSNRPHGPDEIISENYGPVFTSTTLKERQKSLRARYLFDCSCEACRENWPTMKKLEKSVRFRCTTSKCANILKFPKDLSKDVRCSGCRKNINLKQSVAGVIKAEELYREAASAMQAQNTESAITLLKDGLDLFFEMAVLPHADTLLAQQTLRTCFADCGTVFKI